MCERCPAGISHSAISMKTATNRTMQFEMSQRATMQKPT